MIKKIINFILRDVWTIDFSTLPKSKRYLFKQVRIFSLAFREFKEDDCLMRSSALSYYTMLSIVPVFAMLFGIAKGFGLEDKLNAIIESSLSGQKENLEKVLEFSHNLLDNTKGGLIAGVGVAILIWSVIKVMGNIELSFNAIWDIKTERSLIRKFTEYLSVVLLAPIMIIMASSATIIISSYLQEAGSLLGFEDWFNQGVSFSLKLFPYTMMWLLFAFLYVAMPNTKVKFQSAIPAAIIAGTLFQITQWTYFNFQIGVVKYNAIYGSFAALPLFLVWMQTSWMIVLFGGELAFSIQNQEQYEFETEIDNVSTLFKRKTTLVVIHFIIKQFTEGNDPPSIDEICNKLKIPYRMATSTVFDLTHAKLVSEISVDGQNIKYQPAITTEKLSIEFVLETLERSGFDKLPKPKSDAFPIIDKTINEFYAKLSQLPENKLLKDI